MKGFAFLKVFLLSALIAGVATATATAQYSHALEPQTPQLLEGDILDALMGTATYSAPEPAMLLDQLPVQSELHGFRYQLTDIQDPAVLAELFQLSSPKLSHASSDNCYARAHVTSYQFLKSKHQVQSGKVFLFFTQTTNPRPEHNWWFHVAPYVVFKGKAYVIDRLFHKNGPILLEDWVNAYIKGGHNCLDLTGQEVSQDKTVFERMNETGKLLPESLAPCYIRRTPMYYTLPRELYGHDLMGYSEPVGFSQELVYDYCMQTMSGLQKRKNCQKLLGIE